MALKVLGQKVKNKIRGVQEYAVLTPSQRTEVERIGQNYFDELNNYFGIRDGETKRINEKANSAVSLVDREILETTQEKNRVRGTYEAKLTPYMMRDEMRTSIKSSLASDLESQAEYFRDQASRSSDMNKSISNTIAKRFEESARKSLARMPEKTMTPERKAIEADFKKQMDKYNSDLYVWELWKNKLFGDRDEEIAELNQKFEGAKLALREKTYRQFDEMYNSRLNQLSNIIKEAKDKGKKLVEEQRRSTDYKKADVDSLAKQELDRLEVRVSKINAIKLETENELNELENQRKLAPEEQKLIKNLKNLVKVYSSIQRKVRTEKRGRIWNEAEIQKASLEKEYVLFENKKTDEVNNLICGKQMFETQFKYAKLFLEDTITRKI